MKTKILSIIAIIFAAICVRMIIVQKNIAHRSQEKSDIADAGYVPSGEFGHGNLYSETKEKLWYIYDTPAPDIGSGKVRKVCFYGEPPNTENNLIGVDVDFFYFKGSWHKIRSGNVTIQGNNFTIPANTKWKGWVSSKSVFPVKSPDFPYRVKVFLSKLQYGSLSPKEYVLGLKRSNPSCEGIPNI